MIERRAFLRGLFAAPAIVAVGSLMPIRGVSLQGLGLDNLSDADIVRILCERLDESVEHWDEVKRRWVGRRYELVDAPYIRQSNNRGLNQLMPDTCLPPAPRRWV